MGSPFSQRPRGSHFWLVVSKYSELFAHGTTAHSVKPGLSILLSLLHWMISPAARSKARAVDQIALTEQLLPWALTWSRPAVCISMVHWSLLP